MIYLFVCVQVWFTDKKNPLNMQTQCCLAARADIPDVEFHHQHMYAEKLLSLKNDNRPMAGIPESPKSSELAKCGVAIKF